MPARTYDELLAWLYALEARRGMDFKLERIELVLRALEEPHLRYPVIHIAGTNGKGSVAAMLHAIATAAGMKAGLYTSPHLVRFTERIRVGSDEIPPEEVVRLAGDVHRAATLRGIELTFFEFTTVLAFLYFAAQRVPLAVIETGMGGRLDATNVVVPEVSVITSIGFDHQEFLGNTLAAIAGEKAGIIKSGRPVIIGRVGEEAAAVFAHAAGERGAPAWWCGSEFDWWGDDRCWNFRGPQGEVHGVRLGLAGRHQCDNAAVAVAAVQALPSAPQWSPELCKAGLEQVVWPGRLEVVCDRPLVVLDGAHNVDGTRALVAALPRVLGERPTRLVFAVMADKDWKPMVEILAPHVCEVVVTRPQPRRCADPDTVAAWWRQWVPARVEEDPQKAVQQVLDVSAPDHAVLVAGSLFLIGAVRSRFRGPIRKWETNRAGATQSP